MRNDAGGVFHVGFEVLLDLGVPVGDELAVGVGEGEAGVEVHGLDETGSFVQVGVVKEEHAVSFILGGGVGLVVAGVPLAPLHELEVGVLSVLVGVLGVLRGGRSVELLLLMVVRMRRGRRVLRRPSRVFI